MNKLLSQLLIRSLLLIMPFLPDIGASALAQPAQMPNNLPADIYRGSFPQVNDLVHTKLHLRFDYKKRYLFGKEWVTFTPHFYPTDTLALDAKGMDIGNVAIIRNQKPIALKYTYDGLALHITLDKMYHRAEKYTVFITYTAKPEQLRFADSTMRRYDQGLYFVNPDSAEKDKPVQIYTQGETENSSVWFPTIDKPDQKTTDEIAMTVPAKYVTLSNGRLASSKNNGDGTRTDTWKMELPQPPYLFMMAVGDFRIYHDHWRNKEVTYYLEPKYAPYARQIFGMTPEIIEFFSRRLNYDFPWNKYAQIVVRDYGSGGMENTTATLLNAYVQRTPQEMADAGYDKARSTIVHELFHQWFGCLVTCKSWSNQCVDETFAEFSDVLWAEHKYGRDEADAYRYHDLQGYLKSPDAHTRPLVRYHYDNEMDMFDVVTYYKGNCILNMLRNYLGDDAFFAGLSLYLKRNAYKNGEADQLRLALQEVSGMDLHWFFDQWYYGAGNPELSVKHEWDPATNTETVVILQTQPGKAFRLPTTIDIYTGSKKMRRQILLDDKADTFSFRLSAKPDLVNFDGDKALVATVTDDKTLDELAFQYFHAPLYLDRLEAITTAASSQNDHNGQNEMAAQQILLAALKDKFYGLRITAIDGLDIKNPSVRTMAVPMLTDMARSDPSNLVRAAAIRCLNKLNTGKNAQ
jgi:aminopeptidase N